jgi:SOS-response transcriptional repressor LexA
MHIKEIRRQNLRAMARAAGGVTALAHRLERSQSQISHLIGANPCKYIGDKMAASIEQAFNKPSGWLDQLHDQGRPMPEVLLPSTAAVPFLSLAQIRRWMGTTNVALKTVFSNKMYALQISAEEMEAALGVRFPNGAVILIDAKHSIKNNSFIAMMAKNTNDFLLGQFITEDRKHYLKPLNHRYMVTEVTDQHIICGVVCQMLTDYVAA